MVKINQMLVSSRKLTYPGTNPCNYIVIHETANTSLGANAELHARLQRNGFSASWHYTCGSDGVWQSFPDTVKCWHAGDGQYGKGNAQGIGIEICVNSDGNFKKAAENAAALVQHLMKKHSIPIGNVIQHNVTSTWGKDCPHNLRSGKQGVTWSQFKKMITNPAQSAKPKEELTLSKAKELQDQIDALTKKVNAKQDKPAAGNTPDPSHKEAWEWLKSIGLTDGSNPHANLTREQFATLLHRFHARFIANPAQAEEYAKEALAWAEENGISDASNPAHLASRQQLITIVKRVFDLAAKQAIELDGNEVAKALDKKTINDMRARGLE